MTREDWERVFGGLFFDAPVRRRTWRKLSAQLRHGVGLEVSLLQMRNRYKVKKSPLEAVLSQILDRLHKGQAFDVAVYGFAPSEELMLLRGGVRSGRLSEALELCSDLIKARQGIIGVVAGAVAYPLVLLSVFTGMLLLLSLEVIPQLALLSNPEAWDGAAAALYHISNGIASPGGAAALALSILAFAGSLVSLPFWTGRLRLYVENVPPWSMYRLVTGTIWLFTVATLLRSGVQLNFILDDMLSNQNLRPWLKERVLAIRAEYALGKKLGQVLADTKMHFPDDEMIDDLLVYAELQEFHTQLHLLAGEWLQDGIARIDLQAKFINSICIGSIFVLLTGVAVATGSMQQQLGSTMGVM